MKKIHNLLEKISFLNKTRMLLAILILGMASICFFTFISLFTLKYDHEMLFKHQVEPITKLENIKTLYLNSMFLTLQNFLLNSSSSPLVKARVDYINDQIEKEWQEYMDIKDQKISGFARFASWWLSIFVPYKSFKIDENAKQNLIYAIETYSKDFKNSINSSLLEPKIDQTSQLVLTIDFVSSHLYKITDLYAALMNQYIEEANIAKKVTDRGFFRSIVTLLTLIFIVFVFSIFATFLILGHIRALHNYLDSGVKKKTKELEELNSSLEAAIKKEVENSRKKDNILFHQSKLASLGEMLQNIAHQWRQPLGAISMIIQSFEIKSKNGKLTDEYISEKVANAQMLAQNMSETLDDFGTFFNPNKSKTIFSLKDVINKTVGLSYYLLDKESISLHVADFKDIKFFSFKNELVHVLLNLINNAKDALSKKDMDKKIWIMIKFNKSKIIIKVIDNAGGINPEILTKIFDPYFTTKHKSMGTGIGLYMSKQIVEEHMNGKIYCQNIRHKMGTTSFFYCAVFVVEIPILLENEGEINDTTQL